MIPNGKEMNWKGHKLRFESEPDRCRGCFFIDKDQCPDCDEGAWVEDSPWCTGIPTEEGLYWVFAPQGKRKYTSDCFVDGNFIENGLHVVAWQKIEPHKEKKDGIQTDL